MNAHKPHRRSRRRFAPACEGLEVRDLPSIAALLATGALRASSRAADVSVSPAARDSTFTIPLLYRSFVARFQGPMVVGKPRTSEYESQTYMYGGGNSNAFVHGDVQLAYFTPRDSDQPIFGQAVLISQNVSSTGNQLVLDLTAVPGATDRHGRPTRFTWTLNPASGGSFTDGDGSGTAQLIYSSGRFPGQTNLRHAIRGGSLGVIFRGTVGTTNLNNLIRNN